MFSKKITMEATCFIAGKEYIHVDLFLTRENAKVLKYAIKKYEIIEKEIKQVDQGGLFRKPFAIITVYVPLDKYREFTKSIEDKVAGESKEVESIKDKNLIMLIALGVIALFAAAYAMRKITSKLEPEKKPNVFKRFKLWWQKKFSKEIDIPIVTPDSPKEASKGLLTPTDDE